MSIESKLAFNRLCAEERNAIIEECAQVAEQHDSAALSWTEFNDDGSSREVIQSAVATAIRALKDPKPEPFA